MIPERIAFGRRIGRGFEIPFWALVGTSTALLAASAR
jgi:hypothetical protein